MIHTIYPRLNHPAAGEIGKKLYHYDDGYVEVFCEPLVQSTTEAIVNTLFFGGHVEEAPEFISLHFSDNVDEMTESAIIDTRKFPLLCLHYQKQEEGFSVYKADCWYPDETAAEIEIMACLCGENLVVDLCPRLMDYFPSPPDKFYVVVKVLGHNNHNGI